MSKITKSIPISIVLFAAACTQVSPSLVVTRAAAPAESIQATATTPPQSTATATATAANTPTQLASMTTFPPTETRDPMVTTLAAEMGAMGLISNLSEYFHPVGTPVPSWNSIPILSQATAGQEYNPNIYSYLATATLDQARQFYESKASALGITNPPMTSTAGLGSNASHGVTFYSYNVVLSLTTYDNDTGHVIVVISKYP